MFRKKKSTNNCFNLIIPFVTLFAVASLGKKCANPFGPELQVKRNIRVTRGCARGRRRRLQRNSRISQTKKLESRDKIVYIAYGEEEKKEITEK